MSNLKSKKSHGHNVIRTWTIKLFGSALSIPLSILLIVSSSKGIFCVMGKS